VTIPFLEILERPCGGGIVMVNFAKDTVTIRSCAHRVRFFGVAFAVLLVLSEIVPASTYADDSPHGAENDAIPRMNEQIQELQAKLKDLEAKLNTLTANTPARGVGIDAPVNARLLETARPASPSSNQESQEDNAVPGVKLRMFGDIGYRATDHKGRTNSFSIGTMDLFVTGALSDRVFVLGEVVFKPEQGNIIKTDVERLLLQYKHNDYFNFAIGRYHTSIGYYNTAFHQGAWFETTNDRPFMYAFDGRGSFLPLHEVGMTINGQIPSGRLGLHYVAEMGNGRVHLLGSEPAQNYRDNNNGKSINFALYARPSSLPELQTGFSIYHDYLTFSKNLNHDELISTVYVVYNNSNYEFLNEGIMVRHSKTIGGSPGTFHTPGFYTQFSRRLGRYRPYFRYAYVNAGVAEPIYGNPADGPVVGRRNGPTLGLRYDMNDHSAVKLQFNHIARGPESYNELVSQFAFAF
jgi:hypothetical protein